jgi:hypothetical protein
MRNFASMSAILTAVRSTTITRLQGTSGLLPKNVMNMIEGMEAFFDPCDGLNAYVAALKGPKSLPCIPVLGKYIIH